MPELPEVETVARQLAPQLAGKTIHAIKVSDPKLHAGKGLKLNTRNVKGWSIAGVARSGKQVAIELAGKGGDCRWLVVHLRMTGRLRYFPAGNEPPLAGRRMLLKLDSGALGFYDLRRFGTVELHGDPAAFRPKGIDPLSPSFNAAYLAELTHGSPQEAKALLMRQDKLTGLGNIYACEALFAAGIDPARPVDTLARQELGRLMRAIRTVLRAAIRHCGTTFSDFQDSEGRIGGYQRFLKVYKREGEPCRKCGGAIRRIVQQQRSTFFCPRCQV